MPKPIIFLPEALVEASGAYAWYNEKEIGLGEDFYRALSAALTFANRNPDTPRVVNKNYHRVLLRRFPFAVFYRHDADALHVFAVFHCSQNPAKWIKRLNPDEP